MECISFTGARDNTLNQSGNQSEHQSGNQSEHQSGNPAEISLEISLNISLEISQNVNLEIQLKSVWKSVVSVWNPTKISLLKPWLNS